MLPFNPQSEKILKDRFHLAIRDVYDVMSDKLRPGINPNCVFDFEDGLRMIISKEKVKKKIYIHVSASFDDSDHTILYWELMEAGRLFGEDYCKLKFRRIVENQFKKISNYHGEICFLGFSSTEGIPHWIIERDKFEGGK